jgi:GxxExxY protein
MPIEIPGDLRILDQEEFHALDRKLMRIIFDVHNEFGRFLGETLYKNEIAARWMEAGHGVAERELRIALTHEGYRKDYAMDMLFNHGLMLEAKVAELLTPPCRTQGLNYLLLAGMRHGRLVNLRPEKVEHEYLSTQLTPAKRRQFKTVDTLWREPNDESHWLRQKVISLLGDWGAFLEITIYRDAVASFLGGAEHVVRPVSVLSGARPIGQQMVHLLTGDTAFAFTAVTGDSGPMEDHQRRFLKHTELKHIQWINLNQHQIEFRTLSK